MNPQQEEVSSNQGRTVRGRRILVLIFAAAAVPLIAAILLIQAGWRPETSNANNGELLQPARPISRITLSDPANRSVPIETLYGQWLTVTVTDGSCTVACRNSLWKMQQVRLAQGQHMRRVERILIMSHVARTPPRMIEQDFPGTRVLTANAAEMGRLKKLLADEKPAANRIYLIDPNGNLVLRYTENQDATGIRKDLSRLLRLSRIG